MEVALLLKKCVRAGKKDKNTMKIDDNFLGQGEFDKIQEVMMGELIPWYFHTRYYSAERSEPSLIETTPETELNNFSFLHVFYSQHNAQSPFAQQLNGLLEILDPASIIKIKANLITRLPEIVENTFHTDLNEMTKEKQKQWTTSIFYINTNNGYTEFEDGTKVECVANRMVTFSSNLKHRGTSCTDEKTRVVINFNYFKF